MDRKFFCLDLVPAGFFEEDFFLEAFALFTMFLVK
jgi:hypothetical protein